METGTKSRLDVLLIYILKKNPKDWKTILFLDYRRRQAKALEARFEENLGRKTAKDSFMLSRGGEKEEEKVVGWNCSPAFLPFSEKLHLAVLFRVSHLWRDRAPPRSFPR